jgi:hypothetical protein
MTAYDPDRELPIKLGPCSNGEYLPFPLSAVERETINRTRDGAERRARRLGIPRRTFLRSMSGAALMLWTLNACNDEEKGGARGGRMGVPPDAADDPDAARGAIGGDEFVFDVQSHYLNYDLSEPGGLGVGNLFPQRDCGEADERACYAVDQFLDELFVNSDTTMIVVSAIPIPGDANPLAIDDMEFARAVAERLCGDGRVLLHGGVMPQLGSLDAALDGMLELEEEHPIGAWKVYTHVPGPGWWLDDHDAEAPPVGVPFLEAVRESGIPRVCVHKGFGGIGGDATYSSPVDIGPAARANPDIDFVVYHSGFDAGPPEGPYTDAAAEAGVNRLIKSVIDSGVEPNANVYGELGSTWRSVMSDPEQAAHTVGKLLKHCGEDNVLWGTDSIWYGSPQDQIQAFRAFEITPEFQERYGYPALTDEVKRKVLGANAARLYDVEPVRTKCEFTPEELEAARAESQVPLRTYGPRTAREVHALVDAHGGIV